MQYVNRIILTAFSFVLLGLSGAAQGSTKEINYEGLKIIFKKTPKEDINAFSFLAERSLNNLMAKILFEL